MFKIDYLGLSGFPYGLAAIEKQKLIAKGLVNSGVKVTVICNRWGNYNSDRLKRKGIFAGINFIYTSPALSKPTNFFLRRFTLFVGWWGELITILFRTQDAFIVSTENFFQILVYSIIAKIKKEKIYLTYVEDINVLLSNTLLNKVKILLFKKFTWKIIDGAFPISEYLIKSVKQNNPSLPLLKLPTLVDFDQFPRVQGKGDKYFLFCGAARYLEIIEFIIESFNRLNDNECYLYLIAGGSENEIEKLDECIYRSMKKDRIRKFDFLEYEDLIEKYINATGLLIPLRNNIRDIARFPHKIGEYCASRVPILSTNFGEVNFYFSHKKNALLADKFDPSDFAAQMQFVIDNPLLAERIGENSRKIGEQNFDYKLMGAKIYKFLKI